MNTKTSLVLSGIVLLFVAACKKEKQTAPQSTSANTAPTTVSQPSLTVLSSGEYGNSYWYEIGSDPFTVMSTGDLILSSLHYDGTYDNLQVSRVSPSGTVVWNKLINKGFKYQTGSSFVASTGEIISFATSQSPLNWVDTKILFTKMNAATGDTAWTRTYGRGYIDRSIVGHELSNGTYEIVDFSSQNYGLTLLRVAPNGDSLPAIVDVPAAPNRYARALISSDNSVIVTGMSGNFINSKQPVYFCKYSNGAKVFESNIPLDSCDQLTVKDICETADGGFVACGECHYSSNSGVRFGFMLKIDANGAKVWERIIPQIGNDGIGTCLEKSPDYFLVSIFRNPDSGLYTYDLNTLSMLGTGFFQYDSDRKMKIQSGKLYRAIIGTNASYYQVLRMRTYTITN